jgi:RNA polymerase sigma factor (TIGR02999 family)
MLERSTVTALLEAWSHGDPDGLVRLIPCVLDELRAIAAGLLAREPSAGTLQPTALVNELYLRLAGRRSVQFKSSAHFFASMAQMIRQILVDHARQRRRVKRGGGVPDLPLSEAEETVAGKEEGLLALDAALLTLEQLDPRLGQVVHLRFFVGLTAEEVAAILEVSAKTVNRDWQKARLWLHREMTTRSRSEL